MHRYRLLDTQRHPFPRPEGMPIPLYDLLVARGISSAEEAEHFLHPSADDLLDPFLLSDMHRAAARIRQALEAGEKITVYGDYDVDGISATTILTHYLRSVGADVVPYIPSRYGEGYGMNDGAMRRIAENGTKLIVTVDCGVSNASEVALAQSLGVDVVVTDHHTPPKNLPDCAVVDPHLADYPFIGLCGGALAFKLVWALAGEKKAMEYIDIAALATVADIMPLRDESRVIVKLGLEKLSSAKARPGVAALKKVCGYEPDRELLAANIAFQLGPRLNAAGRMGDAMRGVKLLMSETMEEAEPYADALQAENEARKETENKMITEAEEMLRDYDFVSNRAIVILGHGWHKGIVGLTAGKLAERYHRPTIVMSDDGGIVTGSCRSIPGVDIYTALTTCEDLFERYGGHTMAAGLTLKLGTYEEFRRRLNEYLTRNTPDVLYVPEDTYDTEVDLKELTIGAVEALSALEPTGEGNSLPVFRARADIVSRAQMSGGKHLKLFLGGSGERMESVGWSMGYLMNELPERVDVLFKPTVHEWLGRVNVQLMIEAIRPDDPLVLLKAKKDTEAELLHTFLTHLDYNKISTNRPMSEKALADLLAGSVQGTLVLAGSLEAARRVIRCLRERPAGENDPEVCEPDVLFGAAEPDSRRYNTLCVFPSGIETAGWQRVVCADLPVTPDGAYSLGGIPAWAEDVPDLDGLRAAVKACMRLSGQNIYGMDKILKRLAEASGLNARACAIALSVLEDMALVRIKKAENNENEPIGVAFEKGKKADPNENGLFRLLRGMRE